MQITFSSKISFKEYYNYNLSTVVRNPWMIYIFCFTAIPLMYTLLKGGTEITNGPGVYYLGVILYFLLIPVIIYFSCRKAYNSNGYLKEVQEYTLNEDSISLRSESTSFTKRWSSIHKIRETSSFLIIYTSNRTVLLLAKRSMEDASHVQQIKEWASRHVSRSANPSGFFKEKLFYFMLAAVIAFLFLFSYERTVVVPALKGKVFYEVLGVAGITAFGFILMGAMLAGFIALIPRKEMAYQVRFFHTLFWVCLVVFTIMNLFLVLTLMN